MSMPPFATGRLDDPVRSFMERFVLERASSFRQGHEDEDLWTAILAAKRAYKIIALQAPRVEAALREPLPPGNDAFVGQQAAPSHSLLGTPF